MIGKVLEYDICYKHHTLDKFKDDKKSYMLTLIGHMTDELLKKYIPKKIDNATKKGTKIKYVICDSKNHKNAKYLDVFNNYIREYNILFDGDIKK